MKNRSTFRISNMMASFFRKMSPFLFWGEQMAKHYSSGADRRAEKKQKPEFAELCGLVFQVPERTEGTETSAGFDDHGNYRLWTARCLFSTYLDSLLVPERCTAARFSSLGLIAP